MIKNLLKLIRWPNLLMVAFSMWLVYEFLLVKLLGNQSVHYGMTTWQLVLLILSAITIAAGGYIINDIVDIPADRINKPGKNKVDAGLTIKTAKIWYWIFTFTGLSIGIFLAFYIHKPFYLLIPVLTAGLLWFYAKDYQCQPLWGNLVIAILSAVSFGLVFLVQLIILDQNGFKVSNPASILMVLSVSIIYIGFAFFTSWLREIVKDIEDVKGDEKTGCQTLPVVYGVKAAKITATIINGIALLGSFSVQWFFYEKNMFLSFFYFFLIDFIFGWVIVRLQFATEKKDFHNLSTWIKILMLAGILSMILIPYNF